MKCRDCAFISLEKYIGDSDFSSVRCTLGLWDKEGVPQWYSYGSCQRNRGPIRKYGEKCSKGKAR